MGGYKYTVTIIIDEWINYLIFMNTSLYRLNAYTAYIKYAPEFITDNNSNNNMKQP
jgi:hypothetical protein